MADPGEPETQPAQPAQAVAEPEKFAAYLFRVVPVLLEDREEASAALKNAVFDKGNVEQIKKFLGDPQSPALLLQRVSTKGN